MKKLKVGMLLFPNLNLLDFAGPYEVFIKAPCFEVYIVSEHMHLQEVEGGLNLKTDYSFTDCPDFDVIFVPGGKGINYLLSDKTYHTFLKKQAAHAQYITSVCTGSLLLASAGLLQGYKATTHWRSMELLSMLGVEAVQQRVVFDRNRITGGGITAGIDFALALTAQIGGESMAKTIQLMLEYEPEPPFDSGSPEKAERSIVEAALSMTQSVHDSRKELVAAVINSKLS